MHVAMISTYPPRSCGVGSYASYLVDQLTRRTGNPVVTVLTEVQGEPEIIGDVSEPFGNVSVRPCFDGTSDYAMRLAAMVDAAGADVVHIQHEYGIFGFDDRFLELLDRLRRGKTPVVVTLHSVHTALSIDLGCAKRTVHHPDATFDVEAYQSQVCALADKVIVHQERTIRQVLLRQGAVPSKVVTIPHGTLIGPSSPRNETRESLGIGAKTCLLVALGYFEPSKDLLNLLVALREMRSWRPDVRLLVGGYVRQIVPETLDYLNSCRRYIEDFNLRDCVTILPEPLTESAMTDLFAAADIACFVYDEDTRSSSGAMHRALGTGVPIVASRIPKFDELGDLADELLVSPASPMPLARLLRRLIEDDRFRARLSRRTAAFAAQTAWPDMAEKHALLYRALLNPARANPEASPPASRSVASDRMITAGAR